MTTELAPSPDTADDQPTAAATQRTKAKKKRWREFQIVTHRWLSLVLGLFLLVITTSGAVLVYRPEIVRWVNHDAYSASGGKATVSLGDALATVKKEHPTFAATTVIEDHGVYVVTDFEESWNVDPATGEVLGHAAIPSWVSFLDNLHECALSCEGEPGYVGFLEKEVPHSTWLGFDGAKVTWAGLVLGVLGVLTLWLCFTGIWLWWPKLSQVRSSMSVRWKRGRFARDTDLHKVAGMITVPLLIVWGFTGTGFELGPLRDAYTALTPGYYSDYQEATSAKGDGPDLSVDGAVAAAEKFTGKRIVYVTVPDEKTKTAVFDMYADSGLDPYAYGGYPGDIGVAVDRRSGEASYTFGGPQTSLSQTIWDSWSYPIHAGYSLNGWWRILWFVLGMAPLLLAVTSISTWLVRHSSNKARRRAKKIVRTALADAGS